MTATDTIWLALPATSKRAVNATEMRAAMRLELPAHALETLCVTLSQLYARGLADRRMDGIFRYWKIGTRPPSKTRRHCASCRCSDVGAAGGGKGEER